MAGLHRKRGVVAVLGLLCALSVIFVSGFLPLSLAPVQKTVVSFLERYIGSPVTVEKAWLVPWKGVRLQGLRFATIQAGGLVTEVAAEDVFLRYRLRRVVSDRERLRRLLDRRDSARGSRASKPDGTVGGGVLSRSSMAELVKSVRAQGVDIAVHGGTRELVVARDAELRFDAQGSTLRRSTGRVRAHSLCAYGAWVVDRASARIDIDDSIVGVEDFHGRFCNGRAKGRLRFLRQRNRLEQCEVSLKHLDLREWYAATGAEKGLLEGWLDLDLTFDPAPLIPDSIAGKGRFEIRRMVADNIPLQRTLIMLLALPGLSHVEFDRVRSPLKIEGGKVFTEMEATGEPLGFSSAGWTRLDGYFSQDVSGRLSEEFVDTLSPLIRSGLAREDDGRRSFDCTVKGTYENPRLTLKHGTVRRAVRGMFRSLGGSLRGVQRD